MQIIQEQANAPENETGNFPVNCNLPKWIQEAIAEIKSIINRSSHKYQTSNINYACSKCTI